jgi:CelD/BcsL family acetyltransferase involved in cellulose biosynthesis
VKRSKWKFYPAVQAFPRYRKEWDQLNGAQGNHLLLDSDFVLPLLRYFGTAQTMLGICQDGQMSGMVLLGSIKPGLLNTFQPSQAPLGFLLLSTGTPIEEQLTQLLQSLPPHALGIAVLQQDPESSSLARMDSSTWIRRIEYIQTARVSIKGTFREYWQARRKSFVDDLDRRYRRMEREGLVIDFEVVSDPTKVEECIQEFGHLESRGWKGRIGTAVSGHNDQGKFYQDVLRSFCAKKEGRIYRLMINGRTVACDLSLERNGTCVDLKTAYDEQYKSYSVGSQLMKQRLMHHYLSGTVSSVEFYGRVNDWARQWTSEVRSIYHCNMYRFEWLAAIHSFLRAGVWNRL